MGRIKGRNEKLIKSRKTKIMIATYLAVIEKGFANTRAADIAKKANMSQALMFYYFDSMEELFIETLQWVNNRIGQRLIHKVDSVSNPVLQLKIRVDDSFLSTKENRRFYLYYIDFIHEGVRFELFRQPIEKLNNEIFSKSLTYIKNGVAQGYFRKDLDIEAASSMIKANIDGFMLQWLFDNENTFDSYRKRCLDVIYRYILSDLQLIEKYNLLN
ncbi:MAG: TetR/AcrR family transcriptional regulator [Spirochaetes bacterium]|nr:TetR/AcrR family transcriptional regulator [Spirochaetota bacterium]NLJ05057.1 TetR/AcrR family transcriptional regulator [Exilispira sp.]MBP8991650.1 TetR/AcrR family transcriptional regulator [Spirochaetota bacterium]HOV45810.1 TetR/AcrR family transcriptional regulator [Exilispira sp.]HPO61111.1 TetR/AcrR family transcriptional regulator [Exilispira sp.]